MPISVYQNKSLQKKKKKKKSPQLYFHLTGHTYINTNYKHVEHHQVIINFYIGETQTKKVTQPV